jgi:hypothetical protein
MTLAIWILTGLLTCAMILFIGIRVGEQKALKIATQIMTAVIEDQKRKSDPVYGLQPVEGGRTLAEMEAMEKMEESEA